MTPLALLVGIALLGAPADDPSPDDLAFFESKVRPILVERCYECHAVTSKTVRGGLLLDSRPATLAGGDTGPAVEPGKPDDSLLVQAVRYDDPVLRMPPKGKLPDSEIAVLVDWVKRGAPDPRTEAPSTPKLKDEKPVVSLEEARQHWAFQPLQDVEPPAVDDPSWCRTPIDRFILAKLEANNLTPSPEADRRTLLRRAAFDLVGLPPTPEQTAQFLNDPAPDALERLVDRLLDDPGYGDRWARHWLDLARWAESHGFEHDYDRPTAYTYRDFVIEALNRDLPYDTFVKWQLAGDEYEPTNPLAQAATGFLGAGTHSTQITKNQVEKERYDELDDMLATSGTAFLGLTLGCARCHDHKYDPISARDYYRLLATFTTTVRSEVDLVPDDAEFDEARRKYERDHAVYEAELARFERDDLPTRFTAWEPHRSGPGATPRWAILEPFKLESKGGATFTRLDDGSYRVEGPNADSDVYTITAACDLADITAIRVEALADDSLPQRGPGRAPNGNFALTDVTLEAGPRFGIGMTATPRLINAKATFEQPGLPVAAAIDDDPKSGWAVDPQFGCDHAAVFEVGQALRTDSGSTLKITLAFDNNAGHNIGRIRLSATDAPRPVGLGDDGVPPDVREILAIDPTARTPEQTATALAWFRTIDLGWLALKQAVDDHARTAPKREGTKAMICTEGLPAVRLHTQGDDFLPVTHMLRRGDPNQKAEVVDQGFLPVLMTAPDAEKHWQTPPPEGWRTSYRRRALAEWMTDTDHGAGHLLARVIVNRLWQHHFGRGLVATPSDFGKQGTPPTHPELLDWLARELIQGGWKLKPIHRLIMSSAVYRQSSALDPARSAADPENLLLARQTRRRLEAEPIRDAMLAVSGLLDPRRGGPGSLDERMRRRSVYFTIKRSRLIPMMTLFDGPDALVPLPARATTTVAPQSLLLLNSPIVREYAAGLARRVGPDRCDDHAIDRAYTLALARPPRDDERTAARAFLAAQRAAYADSNQPDPRTLALTDLCQVLLGTSEFLFIE
jgi:hypothetical protein